jgi:hypothetical protein
MTYRLGLISQDDADAFDILPKIRKTEETVGYSDTDRPKGSETVTAEPTSTAPDLDSTRSQGSRNGFTGSFGVGSGLGGVVHSAAFTAASSAWNCWFL